MSSVGPERDSRSLSGAVPEIDHDQSAVALLDQDFGTYMQGIHQRMSGQMAELLASIPSTPALFDIYRHVFGGEASYKRSALVYITGDTFRGDRSKLDPFAVMIEKTQTASLIVDDWHDQSDSRRGQPAAHVRFGAERAINAAFAIVLDAQEDAGIIEAEAGLNAGRLTRYVSRVMGRYGMCLGQAEDIEASERDPADMTLEELNQTAYRKTGRAMEMAVVGAALISRVPRMPVVHLETYARHLGVAYQIRDDLEDAVDEIDGSNYVAVIGAEAAEAELQAHRQEAEAALDRLAPAVNVIKFRQILEHVVERPEPAQS